VSRACQATQWSWEASSQCDANAAERAIRDVAQGVIEAKRAAASGAYFSERAARKGTAVAMRVCRSAGDVDNAPRQKTTSLIGARGFVFARWCRADGALCRRFSVVFSLFSTHVK